MSTLSPPSQLSMSPSPSSFPKALQSTGLLASYAPTFLESTPAIGREYPASFQVASLLDDAKGDDLVRDLAITVSQRGVLFLRDQNITPSQMKVLGSKLSTLAGAPASSGLHIHPITETTSPLGDHVQIISSERAQKTRGVFQREGFASQGWHSDITFEPVSSDYALLHLHTTPLSGGDTLWASGYAAYSRLSPTFATFLEILTATHDANFFHSEANKLGHPLRDGTRGSPFNQGGDLKAVHPVVRTNPVTGWKSLFVNRQFTKRINGLGEGESEVLLELLFKIIVENHDLQVRYHWSTNDLAIWDNRSTFHSATFDFDAQEGEGGKRAGDRVCSLGEKAYFDPESVGRPA